MINFENGKSPEKDGLIKEFYWTFGKVLKILKSIQDSKELMYLCNLQGHYKLLKNLTMIKMLLIVDQSLC